MASGSVPDDAEYAARLVRLQSARWKQVLDVQRPYRWNLRRLAPGFTLDIGCGIGRNLAHLDGHGIGIDVNPYMVEVARERGLRAFTPDEFARSDDARPGGFDSLLCSHVVEHMSRAEAVELLRPYMSFVRPGGKMILITPQERGFASDPTHKELMDFAALEALAAALDAEVVSRRSFPFPRWAGRLFVYNEFVVVARR